MKKVLCIMASLALTAVMLFCGCEAKDGRDGRDGKDGKDVTIEEIYQKYVEENGDLSYTDFLKEYLNYTNEELDNATGLKATINKSLMSGVSILTKFSYSSEHRNSLGFISNRTSFKVYTGSGVIIWLNKEAGDAYVVTNCHVIYDDTSDTVFSKDVRLYLYGQDERGVNYVVNDDYQITDDENYCINAEVIGASVSYDIALLKVTGSEVLKRSDAVSASFSTKSDVNVGEYVYAVGNAEGEGLSASDGIISKDSENIELTISEKTNLTESDYNSYRVMRTTAAINHGNSGGALYNKNGEIIGIVNAKDDTEGVDNMGYVLPANNVRRMLSLMYDDYVSNGNKLSSKGGFDKPFLNIQTTVKDTYSVYNTDTGNAEIYEKIMVSKVIGRPSVGKLAEGDYLLSATLKRGTVTVETVDITRRYHLTELLFSAKAGDTLELTVERAGATEPVEIAIEFTKDTVNHIA